MWPLSMSTTTQCLIKKNVSAFNEQYNKMFDKKNVAAFNEHYNKMFDKKKCGRFQLALQQNV